MSDQFLREMIFRTPQHVKDTLLNYVIARRIFLDLCEAEVSEEGCLRACQREQECMRQLTTKLLLVSLES